MKKITKVFSLVMFVATLFLLVACGGDGANGKEKKAYIYLNGSDETIEIGESYNDKGATAKNEKDETLVVLTDNKVDATKIGAYQLVYTVNYNGEVFNEIRTVKVIEPVLIDKELGVLRAALAFKSDLINKADYSLIDVRTYSDGSGFMIAVRAKNAGGTVVNVYFPVYFEGDEGYGNSIYGKFYEEYKVTLGGEKPTNHVGIAGDAYYMEGIVLKDYNIAKINYYVNLDKLPSK